MKKTLLFSLLIITCSFALNAQTDNVMKQIKNANAAKENITCKFNQEHHILAINRVEKLNGTLYYTASNKMAMHYTVPQTDLFIINTDQLYMAAKKRKNLFNLNSNPTMNQLANLLLNSMAGDVKSIADETGAKISYAKDGNYHVFTLIKEKKASKGYKKVILKYNINNSLLTWMKLEEFNGNFNTYKLIDQKFQPINSSVYIIPAK